MFLTVGSMTFGLNRGTVYDTAAALELLPDLVTRRQETAGKRRERRYFVGIQRSNQPRCDQYEQFRALLSVKLALEQWPDDRQLTQDGYRRAIGLRRVVDESGDRERLAVAQLHFRLRTAHRQRRNPEAFEDDAVVEVERADLRPYPQLDQVACDGRREVQPHTEFAELDRDGANAAR